MKYLKDYTEGERVSGVYLVKCKSSAVTKTGKSYDNLTLRDKSGEMNAKIWDPNSAGIDDYDTNDYIEIQGELVVFQSMPQIKIVRVRVARDGEYNPADYMPTTKKDIGQMYESVLKLVDSVKNPYMKALLNAFFREDEEFIETFKKSSAAKSMHHAFMGGLLEHSLSVATLCDFYASRYPNIKRDLLVAAGLLHDIGKIRELSFFPTNDYTDDGQLLGHIIIGTEMVAEKIAQIDGFPKVLASELKHCILAHHGEYEYGAAKKPAIMEAWALYMADNLDAKLEMFTETFEETTETGWLGYKKFMDGNLRTTSME